MKLNDKEKYLYKIWFKLKHNEESERIKIFRQLTALDTKTVCKYDSMFIEHFTSQVKANTEVNRKAIRKNNNDKRVE